MGSKARIAKDIRVQIKKDDNSTKATEKLFLCNLT